MLRQIQVKNSTSSIVSRRWIHVYEIGIIKSRGLYIPNLAIRGNNDQFDALAEDLSEDRNPVPVPVEDWSNMKDLPVEKGGDFGWGRSDSLPSMRTTVDIVGLKFGSSWTHNSDIWINLRASFLGHESIKFASISSTPFPWFHNSHACQNLALLVSTEKGNRDFTHSIWSDSER